MELDPFSHHIQKSIQDLKMRGKTMQLLEENRKDHPFHFGVAKDI